MVRAGIPGLLVTGLPLTPRPRQFGINRVAKADRKETTIMATFTGVGSANSGSLHTDKIVRRLDNFPELLQALRDGDLLTGRLFCAQLFGFDARPGLRMGEQAGSMETFTEPQPARKYFRHSA